MKRESSSCLHKVHQIKRNQPGCHVFKGALSKLISDTVKTAAEQWAFLAHICILANASGEGTRHQQT